MFERGKGQIQRFIAVKAQKQCVLTKYNFLVLALPEVTDIL